MLVWPFARLTGRFWQHSSKQSAKCLILNIFPNYCLACDRHLGETLPITLMKEVRAMTLSETERMLAGHGLTIAEIFYRMPDHPAVLQTFVWQDYDIAPDFPVLFKFLDFWEAELDGPLHSVKYSHRHLIKPGEWRKVDGEFLLN
jgi:uncharacterized protein Usg